MEINVLFLIVILFMACKIADGYKKGMVKEIISLVSLVVTCIVVLLIAAALSEYFQKEFAGMAVAILLLAVLGIVHHLLGVVFFSAKMIAKLPVISFADKLMGIVVGAAEVLLILWTMYSLILLYGCGAPGQWVLAETQKSSLLSYIYQRNLLAPIIGEAVSSIPDISSLLKLGELLQADTIIQFFLKKG